MVMARKKELELLFPFLLEENILTPENIERGIFLPSVLCEYRLESPGCVNFCRRG